MRRRHAYHPHVRLIQRVGEHLDDIFAEKRNAFDVMDHDGLLTEFYGDVLGFGPAYNYFQQHVAQISHRYPNMDVLEIGKPREYISSPCKLTKW